MGYFTAHSKANINKLDINYFAVRNFRSDEFDNDVFNPRQDNYHIITTTGEALSYYGYGFGYDGAGRMNQGTVESGKQWLWDFAESRWQIVFEWSGLPVSMSSFYQVGQSATKGDDLVLWRSIFQRSDVFKLSESSDNMNGFKGNDRMYGYGGNDVLNGGDGRDKLYGGEGRDTLQGSSGDDVISGGKGRDTLKGGSGDDVIRGGKGSDFEVGGNGKDTFLFKTGDDKAIIKDFDSRGTVHDVIDLSGLASVTGWSDLRNHHMEKDGADVVIDGGNGDVIVLRDVTLNSLDKGDFLF